MNAVDTNVLARFYVDDPNDRESPRQALAARRALADPEGVFVPLTVVLELEWVVRALYAFAPADFERVVDHLAALPNVVLEARSELLSALALHRAGLDFADALHLAASRSCERFLTFDDRRFARRARRLGATPRVETPR